MSDQSDPVVRIAKQAIVKLSAELEAQLMTWPGGGPTVEIVRRMKDRVAESLAALAFVNLHTSEGFDQAITLQNEVKRYDEFFTFMQEIINEGIAYDREFTDDAREEMLDVLRATPEGEKQAIALGLIDPGPND